MFSTTTVVTLVDGLTADLVSIVYGVLPEVLTAVAVLMGISLGVRYVRKWIFKSAK